MSPGHRGGYISPLHKAIVAYLEAHNGFATYEELMSAMTPFVPPGAARRDFLRRHPMYGAPRETNNRWIEVELSEQIRIGARGIIQKAVHGSQRFSLTTFPDGRQQVYLLEPVA